MIEYIDWFFKEILGELKNMNGFNQIDTTLVDEKVREYIQIYIGDLYLILSHQNNIESACKMYRLI